jgi:hypothetical protein
MNGKPRGSHAVYIDARSHNDPKPNVPTRKEPRVATNAFYKPPEPEPGETTSVRVETHTKLVTVDGVTKKVESKKVTTGRKKNKSNLI